MHRRTFLTSAALIPTIANAAVAKERGLAVESRVQSERPKRRIGIAFGGGSAHGMAHVGVLKALLEKRLDFRLVTGTSAGSIIAALTAARVPFGEIDKLARQLDWPGLSSLSWSGRGLLQHNKLRELVGNALSGRSLDALALPCGVITTDVKTGERVVLTKGRAATAISASCSVPVLFEPVRIDGRDLVDGGLTEPVPVIALREMGADLVLGIDVAFRPSEDTLQGFSGAAIQTIYIMANTLIDLQIKHADIAIRLNVHHLIRKDNSNEQLVAAGYSAVMNAWPKIAAEL